MTFSIPTKMIYLAGGWFTPEQEEEHTRIFETLKSRTDFNIFNPRIAGEINKKTTSDAMTAILQGNIEAIKEADVIVAIYDHKDTGTIWETGYAYALKKPIIFYVENSLAKVNLMLAKTGEFVQNEDDLIATLAANLPFKDIYNSYEGEIE